MGPGKKKSYIVPYGTIASREVKFKQYYCYAGNLLEDG